MSTNNKKMKVEIWSDVMCPFCYIGKRRFEAALEQFKHKAEIEVVWKSFQLNPAMVTNTNISVTENLAKSKGWTLEYTREMSAYVTQMAAGVGLKFDFDKAVVANSFNAHRLLQFAKTQSKGTDVKELLLKAYFTEGKNTDDNEVLAQIGTAVGLNATELENIIKDKMSFAAEVENDIQESRKLGISGVPYFVIDRKFSISGAQETSSFVQALEKAYEEWRVVNPSLSFSSVEGPACLPNGECN